MGARGRGRFAACASVRQLIDLPLRIVVSVSFKADDGDGSLRLITHEEGEPLDCWTFVPETLASDERLTAWISADASAFTDLEEWR